MRTIWKYNILIDDEPTELQVPENGAVLTAQLQNGDLQLWILVEDSAPLQRRTFVVLGTGYPITSDITLVYVATFQLLAGKFVFHVFEKL